MTEEPNVTTSDERMLAGLAHLFGVLGALIIWATQKDTSRFVRFQAVQALAFDFAGMLFMMILFACVFGVMFIGMLGMILVPLSSNTSHENAAPFMVFSFMSFSMMFACIYPFSLAFLIARIVATISVLSGKNFHYPILGTRVEQFLADPNKS